MSRKLLKKIMKFKVYAGSPLLLTSKYLCAGPVLGRLTRLLDIEVSNNNMKDPGQCTWFIWDIQLCNRTVITIGGVE